jgi:hypothetical protein
MTIMAPEEILSDRQAATATPGRRVINRLTAWPPNVTWALGHSPAVEPNDILVAAEWTTPAEGLIGLRLCKADGQEYGVELNLPAPVLEGALQRMQPGMTLAEIGELEIGEAPTDEPADPPPLAPA